MAGKSVRKARETLMLVVLRRVDTVGAMAIVG
jgi:hypothetical protein